MFQEALTSMEHRHLFGDPSDPSKASFRSICGVAFDNALCSSCDDPTSYTTCSKTADRAHCLVKNGGLRWFNRERRWLSGTEEFLGQGFCVGPMAARRLIAGQYMSSLNIRRRGRSVLAVKHAAGNTVNPNASGAAILHMFLDVFLPYGLDVAFGQTSLAESVAESVVASLACMGGLPHAKLSPTQTPLDVALPSSSSPGGAGAVDPTVVSSLFLMLYLWPTSFRICLLQGPRPKDIIGLLMY